jgi:hypothetical protein
MTIQKVSNHLIYGVAADTKPTTYPANTLYVEQDTGKIFRYTGSAWANLLTAENTGIASANGNGSSTVFTIAHSIGSTPSVFVADCISHAVSETVTADATNLTVTLSVAPSSGTNNVKIYWRAIA